MPVAAFVGRMIRPKGIDVLMEALDRLKRRGVPLRLELYGGSDAGNPEALPVEDLKAWCANRNAQWFGHVSDVREIWRRADIFVLPARSREGMPRALLEAAASARPLIVTDVPGCRHFVRHGVEGFLVPPGNADALAVALERLARDPDLRKRMGEAARLRLLHGFTEAQVKQSLRAAYTSLLRKAHSLMTAPVCMPGAANVPAGPTTTTRGGERSTGCRTEPNAKRDEHRVRNRNVPHDGRGMVPAQHRALVEMLAVRLPRLLPSKQSARKA